ncbi:MAG: hypothetical protein ACYTKD_29245 [Planctomycetota bacterium]|jgi:hypothetical protein
MADGPHTPESPTATAATVDELAKNLPGLPFETKRLRADERGVLRKRELFWREELVPWGEIVGHRWRPLEIVLERQSPDECEVHLLPTSARSTSCPSRLAAGHAG